MSGVGVLLQKTGTRQYFGGRQVSKYVRYMFVSQNI